eukprot:459965-Prymnesium_polylepis.1
MSDVRPVTVGAPASEPVAPAKAPRPRTARQAGNGTARGSGTSGISHRYRSPSKVNRLVSSNSALKSNRAGKAVAQRPSDPSRRPNGSTSTTAAPGVAPPKDSSEASTVPPDCLEPSRPTEAAGPAPGPAATFVASQPPT